jgi:hypothetical protein
MLGYGDADLVMFPRLRLMQFEDMDKASASL